MAQDITKKIDGQALIMHFKKVDDPRVQGRVLYPLVEIITMTLCAILSKAQKWEEIVIFCEENKTWFKKILPLEHGVPSVTTFCRVFSQLCPSQFLSVYSNWAQQQVEHEVSGHIALDGKTLRSSHNHKKSMKALHLINAYSVSEKLLLDSEKTPNKSNEIKGIPILLKRMEITGALISIDAMGTQRGIANLIKLKKADYCLALKANHMRFYRKVTKLFEQANKLNFKAMVYREQSTTDIGHSRYEVRHYRLLPMMYLPKLKHKWKGLQTFIEVERHRHINNEHQIKKHYYISSLCLKQAKRIIEAIRNHWGIENSLHYQLDVSFKEDDSRVFAPWAAENLSTLRKIALACIDRVKNKTIGVAMQLFKNAVNINNLEKVVDF